MVGMKLELKDVTVVVNGVDVSEVVDTMNVDITGGLDVEGWEYTDPGEPEQ